MRSNATKRTAILLTALAAMLMAVPESVFAQRGGPGGGGSGSGGGGSFQGGGGGQRGGGGQARGGGGPRAGAPSSGGPSRGGPPSGELSGGGPSRGGSINPGNSPPRGGSYRGGDSRDRGNYNPGGPRGGYSGHGNIGPRPGSLNNFYGHNFNRSRYGYGNRYGSGYRGGNFGRPGYGMGLGVGYGNFGYGYFPWYAGLGAYGLGVGRGYGSGTYIGQGYSTNSAPVIVEQSQAVQEIAPENDYVPQFNDTVAELGSRADGVAALGITMDPEYPNAAVVRTVTPGSAAARARLQPGDMIVSIGENQIGSPADVTNLIGGMQPGTQVGIHFVRPILRSEVREAAPEQSQAPAAGVQQSAPPQSAVPQLSAPPVPQPESVLAE